MYLSGAGTGKLWWVIIAAALLIFSVVLSSCASEAIAAAPSVSTGSAPDTGNIIVTVSDSETGAAVDGVVVRVTNMDLVDGIDNRKLQIGPCELGQYLVISAPNYKTEFRPCTGLSEYKVTLSKINLADDPNYSWTSALNCESCHKEQLFSGYNEFPEWKRSAHANVFSNKFFASIYQGLNRYGSTVEVNPSIDPAFKLDSGGQAGDCAYCHAPATIPASAAPIDLTPYFEHHDGVAGEGITCDVCHKVVDVLLDDDKYPKYTGILSFKFVRNQQSLYVGSFSKFPAPLTDSTYTCSPVLSKSEFCAACHYGKFNEMTIYNSYGEWRESSYGKDSRDPEYRTCQDCHMSHAVEKVNVPLSQRSACSETAPEYQNFDHNVMDFGLEEGESTREIPRLIKKAASLKVEVKYEPENNNLLKLRVTVVNTNAGHKFPTDSPLRHLILLVKPTDQSNSPLRQVSGNTIPDWGGSQSNSNYPGVSGYAGMAGTIYANLMVDEITGLSPTAAYWRQTRQLYLTADGKSPDTRLSPQDPQVTEYEFQAPDLGNIRVQVRLIYRFAFFDLMMQKDWDRPDVIAAEINCEMDISQAYEHECQNDYK